VPLLSYLKPSESLTELVAGLIMVLTFTLAASVLSGGGQTGPARLCSDHRLQRRVGHHRWGALHDEQCVRPQTGASASRAPSHRLRRSPLRWPLSAASSTLSGIGDAVEDREHLYRSIRSSLARGRLPPRAGFYA